jgi:hypothetical protein
MFLHKLIYLPLYSRQIFAFPSLIYIRVTVIQYRSVIQTTHSTGPFLSNDIE